MEHRCKAITTKNKYCTRNNKNSLTGYCGIHLYNFYKKSSVKKLDILSEVCDNILRFPKRGTKAYNFASQSKSESHILKRGTTIYFEAKNLEKKIQDSIILFKDISKNDLVDFMSILYDVKFDKVHLL